MKANKFVISGLNDSGRATDIEESLREHNGISSVRVDAATNTVTVDYDEGRYNEEDIRNFVNRAGFTVLRIK